MNQPPDVLFGRSHFFLPRCRSWANHRGGAPALSGRRSHLPYSERSRPDPYPDYPPFSSEVNLGGSLFAKRLVRSCGVVEAKVAGQPRAQFASVGVVAQVNVFVLHRAPQSLHHHIVQRATSPVHADLYAGPLQKARKLLGGKLRSLVGVENFRPALTQRPLQCFHAKRRFQQIGQLPGKHVATEPVHDRHQVEISRRHRYVGDGGAPHLVGPFDRKPPQQIRVDPLLGMTTAGVRPRKRRLQSHHTHQSGDPFVVYPKPQPPQPIGHARGSVKRPPQVQTVDHPHQTQVLFALGAQRFVVIARSAPPHHPALLCDRQSPLLWLDPFPPSPQTNAQSFFLSQSISILSRPISSYNGPVSSSSLRAAFPRRNTSEAPRTSWRFHCAMTVGCTPYVALSSLSVRTPLIASSATRAFISSVCFFRFLLIHSLPSFGRRLSSLFFILATCPKNGGNFNLPCCGGRIGTDQKIVKRSSKLFPNGLSILNSENA